ncbi:MAG: hypothetical protein OEV53_12460 [Nitrospira sp.]|nr:hypothetical protein [Nitrospira sp.]
MRSVFKKIGRRTVIGLCLAVTLSACGLTVKQKAALDHFGAATQDFSTSAQTEFQKSRQDVIEMNRARFELGDSRVKLTELDRLLTKDRVQTRVAALQALEDYAVLLRKLIGTVSEGELLEASNSFVSNLRTIKGVSFSEEQAEGIGKAVAAVGGLYVERKRARAVRQVVEMANEPILTVLDLVKHDFDPKSTGWNAGYRLMTTELDGHALKVGGSVSLNDLTAKHLVLKAQAMAAENATRFDLVSSEITGLASAVAEAQQNLRQVLSASDVSPEGVNQLAKKVREFKSIYSLLRN